MTDRAEVMWCTDCGSRFTEDEARGATCCPKCKSGGIPCDTRKDVVVEVNWHELRILGIWAENWACKYDDEPDSQTTMLKTVHAITRRLQSQFAGLGLPPLTLSQEIAELPAQLAEADIQVSGVESNVNKPPLLEAGGPGAVGHAVMWPKDLADRIKT